MSETRELKERVVEINRVAKVVKGGRRFSYTALVVIGDEVDRVGVGYGKAREVPLAITKAVDDARKNLFSVPKHGTTVTHEVTGRFDAARVFLRPSIEGTGVIAGGDVRAVLELAGIRDVLAKSLGTTNSINMARATVDALKSLRRPEDVARLRGKSIADVLPVPSRRAEIASEDAGDGRAGSADAEAGAGGGETVEKLVDAVSAAGERAKDVPGAETAVAAAERVAERAKELPGAETVADAAAGVIERVKDAVKRDDDVEER